MLASFAFITDDRNMSFTERGEALQAFKQGDIIPPPDIPSVEPGSTEADTFLQSIKANRFVSIAQALDGALEYTASQRSTRPPHGLLTSELSHELESSPWLVMKADFIETISQDIEATALSPEFVNAQAYNTVFRELGSPKGGDLQLQLLPGIDTAESTITTFLSNLPTLLAFHAPELATTDYAEVARNSLGSLSWRLAKDSLEKLLAARKALSQAPLEGAWDPVETILDPEQFVIRNIGTASASLRYADFPNIRVDSNQVKPKLLKEVSALQPNTIGCPITLIAGRLRQYCDWHIEAAEAKSLFG